MFWENHDPTQGMRQGNDAGSEYRSAIFVHDHAQRAAAEASLKMYQEQLSKAGYGEITTEIAGPPAPPFYFAEDYHQQYLDKNPGGYCPNHATGVTTPRRLRDHAAPVRRLMALKRMDNVAVVVDDLDAAILFFTELGMELRRLGIRSRNGPRAQNSRIVRN